MIAILNMEHYFILTTLNKHKIADYFQIEKLMSFDAKFGYKDNCKTITRQNTQEYSTFMMK